MAMPSAYQEFVRSCRQLHSNFDNSISGSYSTPSLSFVLGAALVLLITALATFCFSFWYHLRKTSIRRSRSFQLSGDGGAINLAGIVVNASAVPLPHELAAAGDASLAPGKAACDENFSKRLFPQTTILIPVVMPGDDTPKFVARACPHTVYVSEDGRQNDTGERQDEPSKTATSQ